MDIRTSKSDFKDRWWKPNKFAPRQGYRNLLTLGFLSILSCVGLIAFGGFSGDAGGDVGSAAEDSSWSTSAVLLNDSDDSELSSGGRLPGPFRIPVSEGTETGRVIESRLKPGETLSAIFSNQDLSSDDLNSIIKVSSLYVDLNQLQAGDPYKIKVMEGSSLEFQYEMKDLDGILTVSKKDDEYRADWKPISYETRIVKISSPIQSSLFTTIGEMGEQPDLAVRLAEIFAWEIDFFKDLKNDDEVQVIVEKKYRHGQFVKYGNILAARIVNQGKNKVAILYPDDNGREFYYSEEGQSLKKKFLRAPLRYTRISSGYSLHRFHPLHKKFMPHLAIDYAAPPGTPVLSVGDGRVVWAAYKGSNGNLVRIRHDSQYETYYLHLSRFAKGIRNGSRVGQGQVIGYVGATGAATGPHLDFRLKKNGQFINPLDLKFPPHEQLPREEMARFRLIADYMVGQMDLVKVLFAGREDRPRVANLDLSS